MKRAKQLIAEENGTKTSRSCRITREAGEKAAFAKYQTRPSVFTICSGFLPCGCRNTDDCESGCFRVSRNRFALPVVARSSATANVLVSGRGEADAGR